MKPVVGKLNIWIVYLMSLIYLFAGIIHFYNPFFYLDIMPVWLPNHEFLVAISGFVEILFAIMLVFRDTRKISAWLIIGMLIVFFFLIPIPMAIDFYQRQHPNLWMAILRLPIQVLLVWWAWKVSKIKRL